MSTRGTIAAWTDESKGEFAGRYHHFDSYPDGLGKALWQHYHNFGSDIAVMKRVLIDEHPNGWSSIVETDFAAARCYCHGPEANGVPVLLTHEMTRGSVSYIYVLQDDGVLVLQGSDMRRLGIIRWDGDGTMQPLPEEPQPVPAISDRLLYEQQLLVRAMESQVDHAQRRLDSMRRNIEQARTADPDLVLHFASEFVSDMCSLTTGGSIGGAGSLAHQIGSFSYYLGKEAK